MEKNNWEVKVVENFGSWTVDVYLIEKGYRVSLAHFVNGQIEREEIKDGGIEAKPTMTLPKELWEAIKTSMIDNKVREKSEVEAELGATKYHLEDMRKLVFTNLPNQK